MKEILPQLSSNQINSLVSNWENAYGSYASQNFDENVTGKSPFQWVIRTSLTTILNDMNIVVTDDEFNALIAAWGKLTPWPNTKEVLQQLYQANFTLAALSNGDRTTLGHAMEVFLPEVKISYLYSSDYPVMAFKADAKMYKQVSIDGWGAREAGLFSALLHSPPYPKQPLPCFLLQDITELPAILGL